MKELEADKKALKELQSSLREAKLMKDGKMEKKTLENFLNEHPSLKKDN